ncbi:histidine phosphatase family protein [Hyphomicrobium sp. 802]|uniref:histidine phosphatase family protein n=1 Tax=Hyphomicrobium sp. 802 TaxID=1112272 RepID=UPI00045EB088|nr:histidine phosphatase family protein [Hyphomicrobium sp. 802]
MPPRLTFVANASTPAARRAAFPLDEGIDDFGRRDASAMAGEFRNSAIVFSSPARRALETAAVLGLSPRIDPALRDIELGDWAGRTLSSIAQSDADALAGWLSDPGVAPHGGETVEALIARTSVWMQTISEREGRILAVTHPAVMRAAIVAAIKANANSYAHIDIAPLSVVELTSNGRRWALKSIRS